MFSFKKNILSCLLILILILFIVIFTYSYIWYEDQIYSCNFVHSNLIYIDMFTSLFKNPGLFLINLYNSISCFDFNYLHILPLLPFFCIFGDTSRFGFVLGVEIFYLMPLFYLLLYIVYKKIIPYKRNFSFFNVYVITILFLSVQMHFAALHGLAEIVAFIPLFFLILWSYDIKFEEKVPIKNILLFSFLLYLVFLLRRFLIVAETGLVLSLIIFSLYRIFFVNRNKNFKETLINLKNILINLIIIPGVTFTLLFFLVQHEYALSTLHVGSIVYEGYSQDFIWNLREIWTYIGKLPLILFSVSLIILFFSKDKNKHFILFLLSNLLIYTILFSFYLIINIYCLFIILCMNLIIIWGMYKSYIFIRSKLRCPNNANLFILIFTCINAFTFIYLYTPSKYVIKSYGKFQLLPQCIELTTFAPARFQYYEEITEVYSFLKEEIEENPKSTITTYGISNIIDYHLLRSLSAFDDGLIKNRLLPTSEYFSNEGIPSENFNADYVIVQNPVRIDFEEINFLPMFRAAKAFLYNKSIGKSYKCIFKKTYIMDEYPYKQSIYIFKRVKLVTPVQVKELYLNIIKDAPEYREIYKDKLEEYKYIYQKRFAK